MDTYGDAIRPYLSDLVIIFEGMLKEFVFRMLRQHPYISIHKLSLLLATSMDAIVQSLHQIEPVFEEEKFPFQLEDIKNDLKKRIHYLKQKISQCPDPRLQKQKLADSLTCLEKEVKKKQPQLIIIEALTVYLQQEKFIRDEVSVIKRMLDVWVKHADHV